MSPSIVLPEADRRQLLAIYRTSHDPHQHLRAHILLLLAAGYPWATIASTLFCSSRTIQRWKDRYQRDGLEAIHQERRGRRPLLREAWFVWIIHWVTDCSPRDFGFLRSRWCCQVLVWLLLQLHQRKVSDETVRRWLHQGQLVWRRPRPVLGPIDPLYEPKVQALRNLLLHLPADEAAAFQDEVDLNTNPKIGCMWMLRGQQAHVLTPGTNDKCYLAGSLVWGSGRLLQTRGERRNGELFIAHLRQVNRQLRRYKIIHIITDNAGFHSSAAVQQFLASHPKIRLHFLPLHAPQANPIERVWWHLHEEITRNHRCQNLEELVDLALAWLTQRNPFAIEGSTYPRKRAA